VSGKLAGSPGKSWSRSARLSLGGVEAPGSSGKRGGAANSELLSCPHCLHRQKNLFYRTYRAHVRTKPVRSLPPVLPDLLSPLCLSSLASGTPGRPTFPPKRPTPSLRPYPLRAPSCCIRPLMFLSKGLLPTLTNCAHPAALPDPLSPLAT